MFFHVRAPKFKTPNCPSCGGNVQPARLCTQAVVRCRSCGQVFPLALFADMLDEDWEAFYASIPMDRL